MIYAPTKMHRSTRRAVGCFVAVIFLSQSIAWAHPNALAPRSGDKETYRQMQAQMDQEAGTSSAKPSTARTLRTSETMRVLLLLGLAILQPLVSGYTNSDRSFWDPVVLKILAISFAPLIITLIVLLLRGLYVACQDFRRRYKADPISYYIDLLQNKLLFPWRKKAINYLIQSGPQVIEPLLFALSTSYFKLRDRKSAIFILGNLHALTESILQQEIDRIEQLESRIKELEEKSLLGIYEYSYEVEITSTISRKTDWDQHGEHEYAVDPPTIGTQTIMRTVMIDGRAELKEFLHKNGINDRSDTDAYKLWLFQLWDDLTGVQSPPGLNTTLAKEAIDKRKISVDKIADKKLRHFLAFLKVHKLGDIVVMGGAIRDIFFDREISDLDITVKAHITQEDERVTARRPTGIAPAETCKDAMKQLERLAKEMDVPIDAFRKPASDPGGASFEQLQIQYVGPTANTPTGKVTPQYRKGFFVDSYTREPFDTHSCASLQKLAIDCEGNLYGELSALRDLLHGKVRITGDKDNMGNWKNFFINNILDLLRFKHQFGLQISDEDYQAIRKTLAKYEGSGTFPLYKIRSAAVVTRRIDRILEKAKNRSAAHKELKALGVLDLVEKAGGELVEAAPKIKRPRPRKPAIDKRNLDAVEQAA